MGQGNRRSDAGTVSGFSGNSHAEVEKAMRAEFKEQWAGQRDR